jgi:cell wall assembly regulator SMI1
LANYRHLEFESEAPPPTSEEIAAIESELGSVLPSDFREFLEVANGAYLDYSIDVRTSETEEPLCFCGIFSTHGDEPETFLGELKSFRELWQLPTAILPFARDGGGSCVFLDLTPDGGGAIVAFIEGLPGWAGLTQASGFVRLADSFREYVDKLYREPD